VNARDPDAIATFTEHDEPGCFSLEWKLRDFPPVPSVVVGPPVDGFLLEPRPALNPEQLKKPGGRTKEFTATQLLESLPDDGLSSGAWFAAVEGASGMSEGTFRNLRTELKRKNKVHFSKLNNLWEKTASCMEAEQVDKGDCDRNDN
jgi:hypothetical protein